MREGYRRYVEREGRKRDREQTGGGRRGGGRIGRVHESSWSGRMDGRTQTLKSARAIDAINGCVRLVAGKIDDEHRGAYPTSSASLAGESRRAEPRPRHAARRAERMEQRPKYRFLGPYAAVRSMLGICPRAPSCPRKAPFKTPTTRARYGRALCTQQPRLRRRVTVVSFVIG